MLKLYLRVIQVWINTQARKCFSSLSFSFSLHLTNSLSCNFQPIAMLLESVAAKDLACLLAGYCKLLVDPNINVFRWGPRPKMRRIPAEEGRRLRRIMSLNMWHNILLFSPNTLPTLKVIVDVVLCRENCYYF